VRDEVTTLYVVRIRIVPSLLPLCDIKMRRAIVRVETSDGGFVDLPEMLDEAKASRVDVRQSCNHDADDSFLPDSYLLLRGVLLHEFADRSIYSCGGLFLSVKGVSDSHAEFVVMRDRGVAPQCS
jgi:hypothetical protein